MRHTLDITSEICPMTWVRVKLKAESLSSGDLLEVHLKGAEPLRNIPRNASDDGHLVRALEPQADGTARLLLEIRHG